MFLHSEGWSGPNSFVKLGGREKQSSVLSPFRGREDNPQVSMPGTAERESPSEPAQRPAAPTVAFRQSRVPKTGAPRAARAAAGTPEQRLIFPGRKRGLATRAPEADANADRLPPPLPGSHAARGTASARAPRQAKSLPHLPPQTHQVPEQFCSAETRGGFFHLPASFGNQLVP